MNIEQFRGDGILIIHSELFIWCVCWRYLPVILIIRQQVRRQLPELERSHVISSLTNKTLAQQQTSSFNLKYLVERSLAQSIIPAQIAAIGSTLGFTARCMATID